MDWKLKEVLKLRESIESGYSSTHLYSLSRLKYITDLIISNRSYFMKFVKYEEHEDQSVLPIDGVNVTCKLRIANKKEPLVNIFLIIFSSNELLMQLLKNVPDNVRKTIELLTWEGSMFVADLEKRIKEKIFYKEHSSYNFTPKTYSKEYLLFCFNNTSYYRDDEGTVSLPKAIRQQFKKILPHPEGYDLIPANNLEKTKFVFENKGNIINILPSCCYYIKNGYLKFGKNKKPLVNSLSRFQKACEIEEFFEEKIDGLKYIRSSFLSNMITGTIKNKSIDVSSYKPLELFNYVHNLIINKTSSFSCAKNFLSHIKSRTFYRYYQNDKNILPSLFRIIKELPVDKWVSLDNLVKYTDYRDIDIEIIPLELLEENLYDFYYYANKDALGDLEDDILYNVNLLYKKYVTIPSIRASMFFFATIGLIDISYDYPIGETKEVIKAHVSLFDGLKYVRLSKLGEYVTGKVSNFIFDEVKEDKSNIVLDEKRLIAIVEGKSSIKTILLEKIADRIGDGLYKFSYNSFLKECETEKDINETIKLFKNNISKPIPEIWRKFFKKIPARFNPLIPQPDILIFRLSNDKELIQLIISDDVLRKYILKVEDFHIAIKSVNLNKVKKRLESFGYLLT